MSEPITVETVNVPTQTTPSSTPRVANAEVSQVIKTVKPYDDLDAYGDEADDSGDVSGNGKSSPAAAVPDSQEDKTGERETKIETEKVDAPKVEETVLKRTINGKEVEFKVEDAIQAYTKQEEFNRNMDRRVGEVSRRERAWKSDQDNFQDRVGQVIEATKAGDFVSGIRALAKLAAGKAPLDVVKFEKLYFGQLEKVNDIYSKMTPEQQEAYFAKRQAAESKAEADQLRNEKTSNEAQSQLQLQVDALMESNNLAPAEFWGNYRVLMEEVGEGKKYGSPDEITAEEVVGFTLEAKHWEKVYSAGESLGIEDEALLDEVGIITKAKPGITAEEIAEVIKNAGLASPSAVENLNRKVGRSNSQSSSPASSTKKQNANGMDKEDLEFLYRNQPKAYQRIVR